MKTTNYNPHKSSLGMDANVTALIVYIAMIVVAWIPIVKFFAWAVPIVFFFLEKESRFVKFHAMQALTVGIVNAAVQLVLQIFIWILMPKSLSGALNYALGGGWVIGGILVTIATIIGLAITALVVYLMVTAFTYKKVELPVLGPITAKVSTWLNNMNQSGGPGTPPGANDQNQL